MVKVLDASALVAYFEKEPGYRKVKDLFVKAADAGNPLLMATVNWCEVIYVLVRNYGLDSADEVQNVIETFPIEFIPPDLTLTKQAALYKVTKKLPYMDCFAAALTKLQKGELITCDKDFKAVENEIKISWI